MQKRRPKRREGTATQAGGENLLRPLTTLDSATGTLGVVGIKTELQSATLSYLPGRLASPLT